MSESWDTVVIGLGGVGSFALSALSKKTSRVLGIERFVSCHEKGSSHGASRIYRRAYFEHPNYVEWIQFSIEEFNRLQESQSCKIMHECGTLIMEEADGNVIDACMKSALQHNIPVEMLTTRQLEEKYPQFVLGKETVGLLEPGGGFLRPEVAMQAAVADAKSRGATVWEETRVKSVKEVDNVSNETCYVEVTVERNEIEEVVRCKSVVVAAGSWSSELIPSWRPLLQVTRQLQAWMDVSSRENAEMYLPSNMPTWYMCTPKNPLPIYGIPADPESNNPSWIKMGVHLRNFRIDPNEAPPNLNDEELAELRHAARHSIQESDEMEWPCAKPCLYTMSPDEHFIVGPPAGTKRIFCVSGLSGHGFKMTPALGHIMADYALGKDTSRWKTDFCSPSRFGL